MAAKRCYYETLQITKTATEVEIKKAYKKLARENHPDTTKGDEAATERFKEASEAYQILSDKQKRQLYDQYGHAGVSGGAGRGGAGGFQDLGDIFEAFGDIFGGGGGKRGRRGGPQRGADLQTSVTLDLVEAASGCTKDLKVKRHKACKHCQGSGAEPGTTPETCDYCGGQGQVIQSQGFFRVQTACPSCRGMGKVIRHKCNSCYGSGREEEIVTVSVTIPSGIDTGQHLCMRGEGEVGPSGGPSGDLYVEVHVKKHNIFDREGPHLLCRVPITYSQAVLGATVEIPLIDGKDTLDIPAGTQPGHVFRKPGQGMADPRGRAKGDLHVEIQVMVPKKVSQEHETLLRQLAEHEKADVHPHQKSWIDKLKTFVTGTSHNE